MQRQDALLIERLDRDKPMFGLPTASQIDSASAASVLFRFTYGLTYCGGISCTE